MELKVSQATKWVSVLRFVDVMDLASMKFFENISLTLHMMTVKNAPPRTTGLIKRAIENIQCSIFTYLGVFLNKIKSHPQKI